MTAEVPPEPTRRTTSVWSRLSLGYKAVGAVGVMIGVVTGGVTLYDRFFPDEPDALSIEILDQENVIELTDFLQDQHGETVELHVSCSEVTSPCTTASYNMQPIGEDGDADPHNILAMVFRDEVCTNDVAEGGDCPGTWWLYIKTSESTSNAIRQPSGAGSFALDGLFEVRVGVQGFFTPPDVTSAELQAVDQ